MLSNGKLGRHHNQLFGNLLADDMPFMAAGTGQLFLGKAVFNKKGESHETLKRILASQRLTPYLFLFPSLSGLIVFALGPLVMSFVLAFTEWDLVSGISGIRFRGLHNFLEMGQDQSLQNNLTYTVALVPISMALALIIASVLNDKVFGARALRTVFFMPYVSNIVAVSVVWMALFHTTRGPINYCLSLLGIRDLPRWLASTEWALPAIIIIGIWMNTGYNIVIYLAALQNIPKELLEAASIDGAGPLRRFFSITVPLLSPTSFFC
jgi:multiple sugar transport system permease protein